MSDHYKGEQVKTDCCGKWRRLKHGGFELFGKEVWYPFENDSPEGQLLIDDDEITCYECNKAELDV